MRKLTLTAALAVCAISCGWTRTRVYRSPDSSARLTIDQPRLVDSSGLRLTLNDGGEETILYEARGDFFFNIAHAYWSRDRKIVGFYSCGEPYLRIAFDRQRRQHLSFAVIEGDVRREVQAKYRVATTEDSLEWICSNAGTESFRAQYGDATQP